MLIDPYTSQGQLYPLHRNECVVMNELSTSSSYDPGLTSFVDRPFEGHERSFTFTIPDPSKKV